eukprot:PhM_4_TR7413/c0_g1_i1/m.100748
MMSISLNLFLVLIAIVASTLYVFHRRRNSTTSKTKDQHTNNNKHEDGMDDEEEEVVNPVKITRSQEALETALSNARRAREVHKDAVEEARCLQHALATAPTGCPLDVITSTARRLSDLHRGPLGDVAGAIRYLQLEKTMYECCIGDNSASSSSPPLRVLDSEGLAMLRCENTREMATRFLNDHSTSTIAMNFALKAFGMRKRIELRRRGGSRMCTLEEASVAAKKSPEYDVLMRCYAATVQQQRTEKQEQQQQAVDDDIN